MKQKQKERTNPAPKPFLLKCTGLSLFKTPKLTLETLLDVEIKDIPVRLLQPADYIST